MEKLKPCPFCGKQAKVIKIPEGLRYAGLYVVGCDYDFECVGNINHFATIYITRNDAIKHWNRRVDDGTKKADC